LSILKLTKTSSCVAALTLSAVGCFMASSVFADDLSAENAQATQTPVVSPWKGSNAGLGFVMNTGDSQNNNLNANLDLNYKPSVSWTFISKDTFQRSSSHKSGLTAWNLNLGAQANYNFTAKNYVYGNANYINNKFDGYDYRLQESLGYGRNITVPQNMTLSIQFGPGMQQSKAKDTGKSENVLTGNFGANYAWNFSAKSSLTEDFTTVASKQTIFTTSKTALTTNIADNFDLQLSYTLMQSTRPVDNKHHINTTTAASVIYNFA
jgi:putative salt-induced outer membrane protein